jgi:glycine/D-amino acid oxidase-like deaminating enzyme
MSENLQALQRYDVLIVGAGISGIGGAFHLTQQCTGKTFVVLEASAARGSRIAILAFGPIAIYTLSVIALNRGPAHPSPPLRKS